jgi:ABC-type branched-subunit amino acid transport system ATPase component
MRSWAGSIKLLRRIRLERIALLIIEHNLKVITDVTDRLVMLHLGQKIQDGPPLDVVSHPLVIDIYLGGAAALR